MNEENHYKSTDIVKIILACGENKVKLFKQGELEIHFDFQDESITDHVIVQDPTLQQPFEVDPLFKVEQEEMRREEILDNLMITDPELYEEQLAKGFEDAKTE